MKKEAYLITRQKSQLILWISLIISIPGTGRAQQINLAEYLVSGKLDINGRDVQIGTKDAIEVSEDPGNGIIWLSGIDFSTGVVELDMKGKDEFQKSFVGIAYHGQNTQTYEAIYFRPFNFHADDPVRRSHAVQYIAHPHAPWNTLRETRPGLFEKPIPEAPSPDDWFHVRIEIFKEGVAVYLENKNEPLLAVPTLSTCTSGKIGLFLGEGSGGEFRNLRLVLK